MKVTIADIAKKAKVSKMTVSRVLNEKDHVAKSTIEKVNKVIEEFGYQPNLLARSLASKRTMFLGIIIPKIEHMFMDNYIAQIISGVTDISMQNKYRIILCPVDPWSERNGKEYLNLARGRMLDGMILLKTKFNDVNIPILAESGFPFVLVNHKKYSQNVNFVDSRNIKGAKMAMEYLYKKGHRKIAFVAGSLDETNAKDRLKGYEEAIKEFDLEYRNDWVVNGDFDKEKAYQEAEKLLKHREKPTAIFCSDDYMAIGVIDRLKEFGLSVPDDMAVMGFDDIEIGAYIKPSLTTIRQPIYELGKTAAEVLLKIMNREQKTPVHKLLNVELIERESC